MVDTLKPVAVKDLLRNHPELKPPVIDGLLRRGELANLIASPKVGKTFLAINMAYCVANGISFLGFPCSKGRVCLIDAELHPETAAYRYRAVADGMKADSANVDCICLRSSGVKSVTVDNLIDVLDLACHDYSLVVIDALYRLMPSGTSENDNGAMTRVYNHLDECAKNWNSAIVVVHHSSKGSQGRKSISDVGSGAGAISRAADTHITVREHTEPGLLVFNAITRSFIQPAPLSIQKQVPLFHAVADVPASLQAKPSKDYGPDVQQIIACVKPGKLTQRKEIVNACEFGASRLTKLLDYMVNNQILDKSVVGREHWYQLHSDSSSVLSSDSVLGQNSEATAS